MHQDKERILAMTEGGLRLHQVKLALQTFTHPGVSFLEIEAEAQRLIQAVGCVPSFSTVPGYHWATCLMVNDALCHGIPTNYQVESGDLMTIDVGLIHRGYHLDTTLSFGIDPVEPEVTEFLAVGQKSLEKAIHQARVGASVYEVSHAMQQHVEKRGFGAVYQLTGHGIGKELHMDPYIPCQADRRDKRVKLYEGQTVAIEIMYTAGKPDLKEDADGWTFRTIDGSLSGMFEETVLVTKQGPQILT